MEKRYYKEIDGNKVFYKGESIVLGKWRITNPSDEQLLEAGWRVYVPPTPPAPTPEERLRDAIANKVDEIKMYDDSASVNECYIVYHDQTIPYWGTKTERASLQKAVEDYIAQGLPYYRLDLREYGVSIYIPCQDMLDMLQKLEVYATKCYNITSDHIFAVSRMESIDDVESYNYMEDYPEKLTFNIDV